MPIDKQRARRAIDREGRHVTTVAEAQTRYADRDKGASAREKSARRSARLAAKLAADLAQTYEELVAARAALRLKR